MQVSVYNEFLKNIMEMKISLRAVNNWVSNKYFYKLMAKSLEKTEISMDLGHQGKLPGGGEVPE